MVVEVKLILIRRRRRQSCAEGARSLLSEDCAHERLGGAETELKYNEGIGLIVNNNSNTNFLII